MKINRLHAIIGFLLIVIPFTGFTRGFKYGTSVVFGATILYFAMKSIHLEVVKKQYKYRKHDSFVESKPKDIVPIKSKAVPKEEDINTNVVNPVTESVHIADSDTTPTA